MSDVIKIKIKDKEYAIQSSDSGELLLKVVAYVNKKLKEISNTKKDLPDDKTAILAALDIAGDYFQLRKEREDLLAEINDRSQRLMQGLNMVLN